MTVTQRRIGDVIILTSRETGRIVARLYDHHAAYCLDPYANAGRDVFGILESPYDDLRDLPSIADVRMIDAMPVPDVTGGAR